MTAPKPLTPAGLDLRDFSWMPLDVVALLNSDTWTLASFSPWASGACVNLWIKAWHQVPAASLPNDDALIEKWADVPEWPAVREIALRGFVECSDGRLYHRYLASKAIEMGEARDKLQRSAMLRHTRRLPPGLRDFVYQRDRGDCAYCGAHLGHDEFTIDHIYPVARGGSNELTNLTVACISCNSSKGARVLDG